MGPVHKEGSGQNHSSQDQFTDLNGIRKWLAEIEGGE